MKEVAFKLAGVTDILQVRLQTHEYSTEGLFCIGGVRSETAGGAAKPVRGLK